MTESGARRNRGARLWPAVLLLPILLAGTTLKTAGVTEVFDVDVTVMSMAILLVGTAFTFINDPRYPVAAMLPILVFALVVLIGVARSEPGDYQTQKARDFFLLSGVIIACIPALLRDARDLRGLVMTWALAGSAASTAVILVGGAETLYGREGIGETTLGPAYLAAAGLVAAGTGWGDRLLRAPLAAPLLALNAWAVVVIGSRGPLLGALLGLVAWALLRGIFRGRVLLAAVVVLGGLALVFTRAASASRDRLFLYEDAARSDLWRIARSAFSEAPLLGLGWGDYSTVSWAQYPHNAFLETMVELGLLGVVTLLVVLVVAARRTWQARPHPEARVLGAVALAMLVGQQFSSDLTNRIFWIAFIPTLILPTVLNRTANPAQGNRRRTPAFNGHPSQA